MRKILTFVGSLVGGSVGWWVGDRVGFFSAFVVSMLGTAAGIYYGIKLFNHFYG